MSEDRLTYDEQRHKTMTLSERLNRASIKRIKELSEKLRGCVPKP